MTRELVTVADLAGCALCGIPEKTHGDRLGLGHFPDDVTNAFVAPSELLLARRQQVRQVNGLPLAAVDPSTGEPITGLVVCVCRCGATALATPERADGARCAPCTLADAEAAVAGRALGSAA